MHGTATKLKNARNISLTGAVTGIGSFDGSGNVLISTTEQVQTATVTTSKNGITFTLIFKRCGNMVTVNISAAIPSSADTAVGYLALENIMPAWAKTGDNTIKALDSQTVGGGYSYVSGGGVAFSDVLRISISRASSADYRLLYAYAQSTSSSFPDGHTLVACLKYIVS